jgi:adenylate cyclase
MTAISRRVRDPIVLRPERLLDSIRAMATPRRPRIPLPRFGALRSGAGWLDRRASVAELVRMFRAALPGDSRFGDPISTAGAEPAQVLARRAWAAGGGHWTVLAELGLAALQVADWLRPNAADRTLAVLFTDHVGFSSWAVEAGDRQSLEALRRVDAVVTSAVEDAGGAVVKRLGDGTMAVFSGGAEALAAAGAAMRAASRLHVGDYDPVLRAGLHCGSPQPIGGDFIGIDVNIAARLCEAAEPNEILMTDRVADDLDGHAPKLEPRAARPLRGVPRSLELYGVSVAGV